MIQTAEESLDDITRLVALAIRRDMETQSEAILAFLQAGISSARTADLVGTTTATVRSAEQKAKAKAKPSTRSKTHG
jgi:hypothetical protein